MYFVCLATALKDATKPEDLRQLAGVALKNALTAQDDGMRAKKEERWLLTDPSFRSQVKTSLLECLLTEAHLARKAAAQAIAQVAGIELPQSQWSELMPLLLTSCVNPAAPLHAKHAMLQAIGYICEEIDPSLLSQDLINQMLLCFVDGLAADKPVEIQQVSAEGMVHALSFAAENFKDENSAQRDMIMSSICNATLLENIVVRRFAFDSICKVASLYYQHLTPYMDALFRLTTASVDREEEVAVRAIEFWNVICEVEIAILNEQVTVTSMKYATAALSVLVPLTTSCMLKQLEDYDDDQFTVAMAGAACLGLIAQATGNSCLDLVFKFVTDTIGSPDWHQRDAATHAVACLMEGPEDAPLAPFVAGVLPVQLRALSVLGADATGKPVWGEPNITVRDTTAWCLGKILTHRLSLVDKSHIPSLIKVLCESLRDKPRVAANSVYAIHNLSQSLEYEGAHNILTNFLPEIIKNLLECQQRRDWDESELRTTCWIGISELVKNCCDEDLELVRWLANVVLQLLQASVLHPMATQDDRIEQFNLQGNLCGALHAIVGRLHDGVEPLAPGIMGALCKILELKNSTAHEEAFHAIGAVANVIEAQFVAYIDHLHPFLLAGLAERSEYTICITATHLLGDVLRASGAAIRKYTDEYMRCIVNNLMDPELNREVKPALISVFGDVATAIGADFTAYVVGVTTLVAQAAQTQVPLDDDDLVDFLYDLRHAIMEAYTGIVQGFAQVPGCEVQVRPILPDIIKFMGTVSEDLKGMEDADRAGGRLPEIVKQMAGLIGDIGKTFPRDYWLRDMHLGVEWVGNVLKWAHEFEEEERGEVEPGQEVTPTVAQWAAGLLQGAATA